MNNLKKALFASLFAAVIAGAVAAPAVAQTNLPAQSYDDYDLEKYSELLNRSSQGANQAQYDLQNANREVENARAREAQIGNDVNQMRQEFQGLRGRDFEISQRQKNNALEQAQAYKAVADGTIEINALEDQIAKANQNLIPLKKAQGELKASVDATKAAADASDKAADAAQKTAADALKELKDSDTALDAQMKIVEDLKAKMDAALTPEEKKALKEKLDPEQDKAKALRDVKQAKKAASDEAKAKADELRTKATADQKTAETTNLAFQKVTDDLQKAQAQVEMSVKAREAKKAMVANAQGRANQLTQEAAQLDQAQKANRMRMGQLAPQIQQAEQALSYAQSMSQQRMYEAQQAQGILAARLQDQKNAQDYVNWVQGNIQQAQGLIQQKAYSEGSLDGQAEGQVLGTQRGAADGTKLGLEQGQRDGTGAGQKRDYDSGYAAGKARAISDATAQARNDAENKGKVDGEALGTQQGLQAAYDLGKSEGLKHGEETGDDKVAYSRGRQKGEADGLQQAINEAKPEEGKGYDKREQEFLNAPLKTVIIGDQNLADKFKGLQGQHSDQGDDSRYQPRPDQYPHPRLKAFYMQAYDMSYRDILSSTYVSTYADIKERTRVENYRKAYEDFFARDYDQSRTQGDTNAYKATYQPTYTAVYNPEYAARKEAYRQAKYNANKEDPARRASGFKDGNAIASEQKGYREGNQAAYQTNREIEKTKAFNAGIARANDLYSNNAVIKVDSITLRDQDADGIFRPGEGVMAVIQLKNFGLVSKTDLVSDFSGAQGSISIKADKQNVAAIGGQSNATVIVPVQAVIPVDAKDNSPFQLSMKTTDSQGIKGSQQVNKNASYPVGVSLNGFDGILIPGASTNVKITLKNRSQSVQALSMTMTVDAAKVVADKAAATIESLAPGQSKDVTLVLKGKPEARFEETPLAVEVAQANIKFAASQKLAMTIIKRHTPTEESRGLILSANLAKGGGKHLFKVDKFDTWDLRVDGYMKDSSALSNYTQKVVHVMADAQGQIDGNTLSVLAQFVQQNGSVIVWGTDLDQSPIAQQMSNITGAAADRAININGSVSGLNHLQDFYMSLTGMAGIVRASSLTSRDALQSDFGVHGVLNIPNGTKDGAGGVLTAGFDLSRMNADDVQTLISSMDKLKQPFDTKMNLAAMAPAQFMGAVAADLAAEATAAEAGGSGNYYYSAGGNSKMMRAINKFILSVDKNSPLRVEFARIYPILWRESGKLNKERNTFMSKLTTAQKIFYPSVRELYCGKVNPQDQACK